MPMQRFIKIPIRYENIFEKSWWGIFVQWKGLMKSVLYCAVKQNKNIISIKA